MSRVLSTPPASPADAAPARTPERVAQRGDSAPWDDAWQATPGGSSAADSPSVAALGVLQAHVSRLKGFRPRLFRLRCDELTCFKLSGNAAKRGLLPLLRGGDLASLRIFSPDWAAALLVEAERSQEGQESAQAVPPVVKRVVRLQGCTVRLSGADERRFTLHFASQAVLPAWELRAESAACRAAWVAALTAASQAAPSSPPRRLAASRAAADDDVEGKDPRLAAAHAAARTAMAAALAGACSAAAQAAALRVVDELAAAAAARVAAGTRRRRRLRERLRAARADRAALEREVLRGVSGGSGGNGSLGGGSGAAFSFAGATPEPPRGPSGLRTPPPQPPPSARQPSPLARWRSVGAGTPPLAPRTLRRSLSDAAALGAAAGDSGDDVGFQDEDASSESSFSGAERHTRLAGYSSSSDDEADAPPDGITSGSERGETWFDADAAAADPCDEFGAFVLSSSASQLLQCPRRTALPDAAQAAPSTSLWALLRSAIGKDLTRLCLPVAFNEPLSALQGIAEEFEHSQLLDAAAAAPRGSAARHAAVAAFAVASYARTAGRSRKPFNPLEGETYELRAPERRLRFLAEKARHHPPVLTWHAQGGVQAAESDAEEPSSWSSPKWLAWGTVALQPRFGGRRLELRPSGGCAVAIYDGGGAEGSPEVFTWNRVTSFLSNMVLGPLTVSHAGEMRVASNVSAAVWALRFLDAPPGGAPRSAPPAVSGTLCGASAADGACIQGCWWGAPGLSVQLRSGGPHTPLWGGGGARAAGRASDVYNLSAFAAGLNELTPAQAVPGALPPTDSRLRPDQRLLEQGRYAEADAAKQRLEQKQRAARRRAAEAGGPPPPRWFHAAAPPPGLARADEAVEWYVYGGQYWEAAAARQRMDWHAAHLR